MAVRPPTALGGGAQESPFDLLQHEIMAEKAASLGRTGERAAASLARLRAHGGDDREALLKEAAEAVYAYFIQRELCGLRRHHEIIRELDIPREVLARLGAA